MKVTLNWLRDYVDIDITPYELADKLVKAGFEVEEIINLRESIVNVVAGRILSVDKHPNADKLRVCQVDVGNKILQIVCGANNADAGIIVPVALNNATLPDGKKIGEGAIRGIISYGMMCGGSELGLNESDYEGAGYDGLFILDDKTRLGADINDIIGNDDYLMDINITANRPDCNSIIGIAREVSAVTKKPYKSIPTKYNRVYDDINKLISVSVEACDLCPRYMAKVVKDIKVERSPELIRRRLRAVGLRPINNIVDITNYVLIEIGQPMHAFDIRSLNGKQIIVRRATEGETLIALDDNTYRLNNNHLAICDADKPVALGGIMGGVNSCVLSDTSMIVFESARFNRENIRRSSRELNIRSDSSSRFEKGVDYSTQQLALDRALTLLNMGKVLNDTIDTNLNSIQSRELVIEPKDVNSILGIKIDINTMIDLLNSLGIVSQAVNNRIVSIIPMNREDLIGVNDIAEEIIRLYGYNHITSDKLPPRGGKTFKQIIVDRLKNLLVGEGMNEIITYSFTTPKAFDNLNLKAENKLRQAIKLKNALGEDLSMMRTTLAHSMLSTISSNLNKGNKDGRLFEVARVYIPHSLPLENLPVESEKLMLGIYGNSEDFFTVKGIIENIYATASINIKFSRSDIEYLHPGVSANIHYNDILIGYIGEVHPDVRDNYDIKHRVYIVELDLKFIQDNYQKIKPFNSIPKYPAIERDLAIVVDDSTAVGEIIDYIKGYDSLIRDVQLFDVYRGVQVAHDKKSVALSIILRADDRTLRDEETSPIMNKLIESLNSQFKAKLRE